MNRYRLLTSKDIFVILIGSFLSALSCLFANDGAENVSTPITMALSAFYVFFSIRLPIEQQLMLVAIGIPNTKALSLAGISCSIIVCACAIVTNFIKLREKPILSVGVVFFLLYSFFAALVRNSDIVDGIVMPIKQAINMIFFLSLANSKSISQNAFCIGLKSTIAFFFGILCATMASFLGTMDITRLEVVGNDSNILAVEVSFVLSSLCVAYTRGKSFSLLVFSAMFVVLALIIVVCGSRMGFLLFALIVFLTILMNFNSSPKLLILAVLMLLAGLVFMQSEFGQDVITAIQFRMEVLENADVSNGRFEIWDQYISTMTSSPLLLLFGLGDFTQYGIEHQAHNFLIEDIAQFGVLGVLILYPSYVSIYRKQYKAIKRENKKQRINLYKLLPLLTPILGSLTLHGLASIMGTTMIYLGVLALASPKRARWYDVVTD